MSRTLAGILAVRNGIELDYSWEEAGKSLLGVCDELVLDDCDSTDGTWERMQEWASVDPRITLAKYPWTNPVGTNQWWPEFLNHARQHAKADHILHLDADEAIHENDYGLIRSAANNGSTLFLKRLNFWRDPQHLIPEGFCCGTKVLRMAPANMPIPSDYPWEPAEATMKQAVDSSIRVFHYGFLRRREAFFKKAKVVQNIWAGDYDPRLRQAESSSGNWMENPVVSEWINNLSRYTGTHPEAAHMWLLERGYSLKS